MDTVVDKSVPKKCHAASPALLSHVAGLNKTISENISQILLRKKEKSLYAIKIKKVLIWVPKPLVSSIFLKCLVSLIIQGSPRKLCCSSEALQTLGYPKDLNEAQNKFKSLSVKEMAQN